MPRKANARPGPKGSGAGAATVLLGGERAQHTADRQPREAADPILDLLARLDAAIAREGVIEVDGRHLLVRPISGGYAIETRS